MMNVENKLKVILNKCDSPDTDFKQFMHLNFIQYLYNDSYDIVRHHTKKIVFKLILFFIILHIVYSISCFYDSKCLVEIPVDSTKMFRKSETCKMCHNVTNIKRIKEISQLEFDENYANTGIPVVISDGAVAWPAIYTFDFEFLKNLYYSNSDDFNDVFNECQFFPYKTDFKSLNDVFNMSGQRSKLEKGTKSWYVGWSNCNNQAGKILRKYYSRPYFLPENSENIALSWIFMGGPGNGAHMHVDNVIHPSWQAQLRGKKKWYLMPPPECLYQCSPVSITVHPGEIIVVDTNRWYHQTFVLDGEISITIGSEFD